MTYKRFEDVPVWQDSRSFVNKIYHLINSTPKLKHDFALNDQLKRASYSIMLNIAEGFERGSNKDFSHFICIAKSSSGEVRSILYILLDNKYIDQEQFNFLYSEIEKISTHLSNFRKYLLNNKGLR